MKTHLVLIFLALFALDTSCKKANGLFGKSSKRSNDLSLLARKNSDLQQKIHDDSVKYSQQLEAMKDSYDSKLNELQKNVETGKVKDVNHVYYVVVGAFKNMKYAGTYSEKIKSMGHEGLIVEGPNNFHLVTYGTYTTLKNSLPALQNARSGVATESWVYFQKVRFSEIPFFNAFQKYKRPDGCHHQVFLHD